MTTEMRGGLMAGGGLEAMAGSLLGDGQKSAAKHFQKNRHRPSTRLCGSVKLSSFAVGIAPKCPPSNQR
jgi:hypothetical protein